MNTKKDSTMKRNTANKDLQNKWRNVTDEAIRIKAYDIWQRTGCPDSLANWLMAEKLLKG